MLQDYPAAVQYLDAREIERYTRKLPATLEGTLQVLAELLPLLGDELVPVWQSEPLPSQPVALVSFLDKSGEPLVAVVCESGLLWVANAKDPEVHAALLIPEVGPEGGRVRGLFACQALRPFGQWTELLVPVLPGKSTGANQGAEVYRALASFQSGKVRLEPAVEDAARDRTRQPAGLPDEWPPLPLPDSYKYLLRRTEVFSGGVDALTLEDRRSDLDPDAETTLRLWGRHRSLDVQGRTQLVLQGRRNERESYPLPHPVKSGVVVPSAPSTKSFQVVLAQEGRRLEGLVVDKKVQSSWHQRLQYEPVAIDCSLETAPKGGWPDLFIALDDRSVVRFGWRGAASLGELWKSLVENLGKIAGLSTPTMWTAWTCQQFRRIQESQDRDKGRTRRVLHYLAADRALGTATGDDLETVKQSLVQQVAEEVETDLLLPAAWRLLDALKDWESDPNDRVPDLVWAFYEKVPFSIQELFDSHLRSGSGERLRGLNPSYDELLKNAPNVVSSYRDRNDPLRDKGILLLQAFEPYTTASIMPPRRDFRFRHMVRLDIDGQPLLAAVGAHEIRLYRVRAGEVGLDEVEEAYTDLGDVFTTQFAQAVDCGDDRVLVLLGSLQGKLAAWDPTPAFRADEAQSPLIKYKEIGGSLSAAVEWSSSQGKGRALVAQNRHQGACLLPVWMRPGGGIEIEAEIETGLEWIQSLQTMVHDGRPLLALGTGEELALLAGNLEPGKPAVPTERFPLGASVSVVACLTSEGHRPLVTACTREGQVFCIELGSELRPKRFRWIYQVPRGASGVLSRAGAQMPLGIISTQGTVTLLSSNGDLVFDYRRPDPIDAGILLTIRDESWLIVGRHSGGLTILLANRGSDQILKDARRQLAEIPPEEIETQPPANEAREVGWLFARFEKGDDPCSLYDNVAFEISRAVLVRLTSQGPNRVHSQARDWVEKLSLRDLSEFLRRLPSGKAREWVLQSWERVLGSNSSGQPLERGLQDEGMALYELLRHSRREGRVIPIERLRSLPGVESDWISYLVAQYLVEEIDGQAKKPARMLSPLLAALALFPLKVTRAAFAIAAGSEELREVARVLNAIMELGEVIARKGQPYEVQASLKHLAATLESWKNELKTPGLLARFIRFVYDPDQDGDGSRADWPRLLELLVEAKKLAEPPSALQRLLFSPVANLLPSLPPGPDAKLSEEATWLQETRERLQILPRLVDEADQQSVGTATEQVWKPMYDEILSRARDRMQHLCTVALDELRNRVRVHVRQRSARYLSAQMVQLELEAQPETLDRASNVRFEIALNISGGLASVDKPLTFKEDIALLEKVQEARVFNCEGRLAPGQTEVQVRVTVQHGETKPFERLASLRLSPFPVSSPTSRAPFPDALAARSRELVDELRRSKRGCRFVLLDESLGRSQLLSRAEGPGIHRVDLDIALAELGPGRPYPDLLNLGNILAALRGEQVPAPGEKDTPDLGPGDPILVAPCDDFWDRLSGDPSLQNLLSSLLTYLSSYRGRSLTFVLDSRLGARLRRSPPHRRIEWIAAYRLEDTESDKVREEAAQWLVGEAATVPSNRLGETALQRLGGDLRLGLQFRPLTRDQDLASGTLDEILGSLLQTNAALEVLRADLEGLPPEAIHLLIVAACSQTTFRFTEAVQGLVAAETIYSTASGGRRGRPILGEGQRIDTHTLTSLRSDHDARSRTIAVAGFSSRRPCSIQERIEHLALFLGTETDVENMGKLLSGIGAAELHEGVIRARSPFRELIRDAVQQRKPPAEVYQLLSGGPSPLVAWSLPLFARLTADKIQQIDTRIERRQASMLQLLGATWHAMAERRSFPETQLRRALDTLTGRDVAWVAGSGRTSDHLPRWESDNWDLLFSLGEPQSQRETPYHLLILAAPPEGRPEAEPTPQLLEALTTVGTSDDEDGQNKDQIRPSLLLVARPGGRAITNRERRWIELSDEELRTAALNPEWVKAFWGLVKTRAGLKALAPFKREGALPPGSPVFAGRDEELQYMMRHLRQRSFLIVGSRQVGKTSLLNELRFRVQNQNDSGISCYYMDLQGISHSNELSGTLLDWPGNPEIRDLRSREFFTHLVELASKSGRFPVFLLNEVDTLLRDDIAFLWFLRGLHDANRAQFIMTGYTQAASSCQDPKSPFYHWTTSPDSKRKYLALAELTPRAAEKIIEVLEKPPLELVWDPPQEKVRGQRLILDRSYRIPHLIQAICLGLVERLERSSRYSLRHDDVVAVVSQREISAWDRVINIDLSFAAPNLSPPELARTLVQLVLHVAMKNLYFSGARPRIQDQLLPSREASTVTFSAEEVHRWLPQSLKGLLIASEVAEANKLINQVDIDAMLSALTLTLLLSYDLRTGRYFFPGHLYPRELQRNLRPGELIEDRTIELVLHFAYFLPGAGSSRPAQSVSHAKEGNSE